MFSKALLFLFIILLVSCSPKKQEQTITWLYGYGQVEKLNGTVKKVGEKDFVYLFDKNGSLIKIRNVFNGSSDTTNYKTIHKDGKKTEAIGLYFDRGRRIKEVYIYDDSKHLIRCIGNLYDLSTDTDRFIYDKDDNLAEHDQYYRKKPLWIFKYKYLFSANGKCIGLEQSFFTWRDNFKIADKDTMRYIAFDSEKNWLKAVDFSHDTITRTITYY